ncbi:MAG: WbqC family protein [Lentisphaeraceae bacterium]|nr:WbqC family protein [Lentisphaeraceae bacterium]
MRVTVMQPAYLPWMGFFQRCLVSDVVVLLDDVDMDFSSKTKFTNRNRVLGAGQPVWLTIPINKKKSPNRKINQLLINNDSKWQLKHWRTIERFYSKAAYWDKELIHKLKSLYEDPYSSFMSLLDDHNNIFFETFDLQKKIIKSSTLNLSKSKDELILEICSQLKATEYISGPFGRDYLNAHKFIDLGINVLYHDYQVIPYQQVFLKKQSVDSFVGYLSILDAVLNIGVDETVNILSKNVSLLPN